MKKWLVLVIAIMFVGATLYGSYQWKQRHLSSGFKHILLVLFDPSNTNEDVRGYLHDARLMAKTAEDNRLLSQVERMIQLRVESAQKHQEANEGYERIRQRQADITLPTNEQDAASKKLNALRTESLRLEIVIEKGLAKPYDLLEQQAKELSEKADALDKSIRSELKLPPASPR